MNFFYNFYFSNIKISPLRSNPVNSAKTTTLSSDTPTFSADNSNISIDLPVHNETQTESSEKSDFPAMNVTSNVDLSESKNSTEEISNDLDNSKI